MILLLTYKHVADVAVDRDQDDRRYRPRDPRQKPVDELDGVQADMAENQIGPATRKLRQLRYVCWFQRVWQLYTRREFLLVFVHASIVPGKINVTDL